MAAATDSGKRRRSGRRGNGEGTIVKTEAGYRGRISLPDGKYKWFSGKKEGDVRRQMQEALADLRRGLPLPDNRQTLGGFLDR